MSGERGALQRGTAPGVLGRALDRALEMVSGGTGSYIGDSIGVTMIFFGIGIRGGIISELSGVLPVVCPPSLR